MKLVSGSLLVVLVSSAAWAAAPPQGEGPAPARAAQTAPAAAASGERIDLARKFVALTMREDKFVDTMRAVSLQFASEKVLASEDGADTPPEVIEEGVDAFFERIKPVMHARMPKLFEAYAQAYAREFSVEELTQMNAFAASPTGRHYLANPEFVVGDEGIAKAQIELQEAILPVMQEMRKEECAKRAAARVAAGDKKATCPLAKAAETRAG